MKIKKTTTKTLPIDLKQKTLNKGGILTVTDGVHSGPDSCMAMRQKAVMEASESVPNTSP